MSFEKWIITYIHHFIIIQNSFSTLKMLCALPIHLYVSPTPGNHWSFYLSFYCLHSFAFSDWLLSLSNMHLGYFMFFHGLIVHFFLALNNIPLSGCTTVYLFIHLTKDILVASKFCQFWIKLLHTSMSMFLCEHNFLTPLGEDQGMQVQKW